MKIESVYINPLTDFGFKFLFGQEENKEFLLSFLNALFQGTREIVDVEFIDKEKVGQAKDDRALIYDVYCKTAEGERIIVEMQNRYQSHFRDRALYYLSSDIYRQAQKGKDWDYSLIPVYGVFLMNFDWREGKEEQIREDACLMNIRTHEIFSDKIGMTFIKIPMMTKDAESCRDKFEKWLYVLKNMDKMEAMPRVFLNDPVFRKLGQVAKVAALNDKERAAYDRSLKTYRDAYAIAKTERTEGLEEGIQIGRKEGRKEGRQEGTLSVAKNLMVMGMADEVIIQATGLTAVQIRALRDSI